MEGCPVQEASVKLSAYENTICGVLNGEVKLISANTFRYERKRDGDPHYKVTVRVGMLVLTDR